MTLLLRAQCSPGRQPEPTDSSDSSTCERAHSIKCHRRNANDTKESARRGEARRRRRGTDERTALMGYDENARTDEQG